MEQEEEIAVLGAYAHSHRSISRCAMSSNASSPAADSGRRQKNRSARRIAGSRPDWRGNALPAPRPATAAGGGAELVGTTTRRSPEGMPAEKSKPRQGARRGNRVALQSTSARPSSLNAMMPSTAHRTANRTDRAPVARRSSCRRCRPHIIAMASDSQATEAPKVGGDAGGLPDRRPTRMLELARPSSSRK